METLTFENLPEAVSQLTQKLDKIEQLLLLENTKENTLKGSKQTDDLMTVKQAAKFLSLSVATIYLMTSKGTIPFFKKSKRIYFSKQELIAYLKEGRNKTSEEIKEEAESYLVIKNGLNDGK